MKHLISLKEQTRDDILEILDLTDKIKARYKKGEILNLLANKSLLMLFQKTSTRTRTSFEAGMTELGGHAIYLDSRTTQLGVSDFKDEIRAVMKMVDVLIIRALKVEDVELAATLNIVPVIDGCSEKYHPCQALGDIFTMEEESGGLENVKKITWLGIENNVSNSLTLACAKLGIEVYIVSPERDRDSLDEELIDEADQTGKVHRTLDLKEALIGANFVHTDTWVNMEFFENGKIKDSYQGEYERRVKLFKPYQLNAKLLADYNPKAKIMHCMPCHVGYEITRDAIDHANSVIFKQAENRKHIQKAIILWLLKDKLNFNF